MKKEEYYIENAFLDHKILYTIEIAQGVTNQTKFNDIARHFAENYMVNFINEGYTNGYADGTFRPNKAITRAEFVKFTNKVFDYKQLASSESFTDVNPTDWYYNEVRGWIYK